MLMVISFNQHLEADRDRHRGICFVITRSFISTTELDFYEPKNVDDYYLCPSNAFLFFASRPPICLAFFFLPNINIRRKSD